MKCCECYLKAPMTGKCSFFMKNGTRECREAVKDKLETYGWGKVEEEELEEKCLYKIDLTDGHTYCYIVSRPSDLFQTMRKYASTSGSLILKIERLCPLSLILNYME